MSRGGCEIIVEVATVGKTHKPPLLLNLQLLTQTNAMIANAEFYIL